MRIRELAKRDLPLGYFNIDELQISAYKKGYRRGYEDCIFDSTTSENPKTVNVNDGVKYITELYAIQNVNTGNMTFSARGGGYQDFEAARKKLNKLGEGHVIRTFRLVEETDKT